MTLPKFFFDLGSGLHSLTKSYDPLSNLFAKLAAILIFGLLVPPVKFSLWAPVILTLLSVKSLVTSHRWYQVQNFSMKHYLTFKGSFFSKSVICSAHRAEGDFGSTSFIPSNACSKLLAAPEKAQWVSPEDIFSSNFLRCWEERNAKKGATCSSTW